MELVFRGMKTRDGCITYFFFVYNLICSWLEKKHCFRINYYLCNIKKTINKRDRIGNFSGILSLTKIIIHGTNKTSKIFAVKPIKKDR